VPEQDCGGEGECEGRTVLTRNIFCVSLCLVWVTDVLFTSFSWRPFFFHQCVPRILFAPLKSQGISSRQRFILEETRYTPSPFTEGLLGVWG